MLKQQAVWIFWKGNRLANADYLRDCLDAGQIVATSDIMHNDDTPDTVIYILEKEFLDNESDEKDEQS